MITAQRKGENLEVEFCGKTEEIVAEYVAIISGFQERFGEEVTTFITAKGLAYNDWEKRQKNVSNS